MKNIQKQNKGFTLIELLVVVLIIGVLAAIALPQYKKVMRKAIITEAITQIRAIATAEQDYYLVHGQWTSELDKLNIERSQPKHFYLALPTSEQHIYAGFNRAEVGKGKFYIAYDLEKLILYCTAYKSDEEGNKVCQEYGTTPINCRWNPPENCYPIK